MTVSQPLKTLSEQLTRPALYTREEAATYLNVRPQTLALWASTKRYDLPFVKVGRAVRYRLADLDAFIDRRTVGVGAR